MIDASVKAASFGRAGSGTRVLDFSANLSLVDRLKLDGEKLFLGHVLSPPSTSDYHGTLLPVFALSVTPFRLTRGRTRPQFHSSSGHFRESAS